MTQNVTRRDFLAQAASTAVMIALARPRAAAGRMYVSLNPTLTRQMPWPDFVRLAGTLGYGGVDVQLNSAKAAGVEATRALLAEARVKPAIANLPVPFATPEQAVFDEGLRQLDENAKFAAAIGLGRMMTVLPPGSPVPPGDRRRFLEERLAPVAEILHRSNIRLGLEFLGPLHFRTGPRAPYQFIWQLPETVAFAKECGPNIGVTLDAWHWHHSGGTAADIVSAGKARIVHVHVSDAKRQPPEEVRDNQRLMPGEGVIDLVGFFRALETIGYEDGVSPEPLGRVPDDMSPEEGAKLGLETTTGVMRKAGAA
jgi:sugar phosphate isomerase/epimerase